MMTHQGTARTVHMGGVAHAALLPAMDLTKVRHRVAKEHQDWSSDRLDAAENSYRQFWFDCKTTAGPHRPSKDVDQMWHAHVLHTCEYMQDCQNYFGYFLHHVPDEDNHDLHAKADCQGGGDGCTACGSGCQGGGTVKARCNDRADCDDDPII